MITQKNLVLIVLVIGLLASTGCTTRSDEVDLGAEANGTQIELPLDATLVITLDSNPSTGYAWHVAGNDGSVLAQVGEAEFVPAPGSGDMVGAGGQEVLRFEPTGSGTVVLTLTYDRQWESEPPEQTFTVTVVVP